MIVYLLTEKQKNELIGIEYIRDCMFNPIQDAEGNWIISTEEVEQCCDYESLLWVKELPIIEFNPKKDQL